MAKPFNNINYLTISEIPPNVIINYAYNATGQVEYEGHAIRGTADATEDWTIKKYVYSSNRVSTIRIAHGVSWDNRVSVGYS